MSEEPVTQTQPAAPKPKNGWSFQIGNVLGIPIRLHATFLLLLIFLALSSFASRSAFPANGLLYAIGLFTCVLLHELGHSVFALRYGIGVSSITLYPIGGIAAITRQPKPAHELVIAIAGPLVNAIIAAGIFAGLLFANTSPFAQMLSGTGGFWQKLMLANIALGLFNLLPAFPMDGGRILRAFLALFMPEEKATGIAGRIGQAMAILLFSTGIMFGMWSLVLVAAFVFLGAGQEISVSRSRVLVEGLTARDAMITDFRFLQADATLEQATHTLLATPQHEFPVALGDQTVGLLTREQLLHAMETAEPTDYVSGVMNREYLEFPPSAPLESVLEAMQFQDETSALVKEDTRTIGLIDYDNLSELLSLRSIQKQRAA